MAPPLIIVMGVCGTGKSTLSTAISNALQYPHIDADDLHPASNVAKMSQGIPLVDDDRWPWLDIVRAAAEKSVQAQLAANEPTVGVVVACSSLRKVYRDILRTPSTGNNPPVELDVVFVHMHGTRELLLDRMAKRANHFMKPQMVDSQLATLEMPTDEPKVVTVKLEDTTEEQKNTALNAIKGFGVQL